MWRRVDECPCAPHNRFRLHRAPAALLVRWAPRAIPAAISGGRISLSSLGGCPASVKKLQWPHPSIPFLQGFSPAAWWGAAQAAHRGRAAVRTPLVQQVGMSGTCTTARRSTTRCGRRRREGTRDRSQRLLGAASGGPTAWLLNLHSCCSHQPCAPGARVVATRASSDTALTCFRLLGHLQAHAASTGSRLPRSQRPLQ